MESNHRGLLLFAEEGAGELERFGRKPHLLGPSLLAGDPLSRELAWAVGAMGAVTSRESPRRRENPRLLHEELLDDFILDRQDGPPVICAMDLRHVIQDFSASFETAVDKSPWEDAAAVADVEPLVARVRKLLDAIAHTPPQLGALQDHCTFLENFLWGLRPRDALQPILEARDACFLTEEPAAYERYTALCDAFLASHETKKLCESARSGYVGSRGHSPYSWLLEETERRRGALETQLLLAVALED